MNKLICLLAVFLLVFGCTNQSTQVTANQTTTVNTHTQGNSMNSTTTVQSGSTVTVDYVGTLDNGTVFDTSIEAVGKQSGLQRPSYSPLSFQAGAGQMIKGFDSAVIGMNVGEEKTIHLNPEEAYGETRQDLIISVPVAQIQGGLELSVGSMIQTNTGATGTITAIENGNATIDFNSELAGKALNFKIKVLSVK